MNPSVPTVPPGFRWGAASSAFQTEGAVDAGGRGPSIWDDFCRVPGAVDNGDTGEIACDSYRRWPADLAVVQQLGIDAYRFSIAWPRVQAAGTGPANAAGLDHYDRMVDDLLTVGVTPFVTLYHWDLPSALQTRGGWVARDTAYRFADFSVLVAERLGDRVTDWVTVNEPLCIAWIGHLEGRMAPGRRNLRDAVHASHHVLLAHGLAVQALRSVAARPADIGIVLNLSPCEPASGSDADRLAAERADGHTNRWWLDPLHGRGYPGDMLDTYAVEPPVRAGDLDAIAAPLNHLCINYYFRVVVAADPTVATLRYRQVPVAGAATTAMGWEVRPQGLHDVLMRVKKDYDPPAMYVTENGAAFEDVPEPDGYVDDAERTDYLRAHIAATTDALADGAPVRGYFAWALTDNFEWAYGYAPRFGLARVDYPTQRRTLKRSGATYRQLIEASKRPTTPS